jgi:hypothetical protein
MFLFAKALRDRMQKKIRRVVTGHNAVGKSIFIMDEPSPHVFNRGTGSVVVTDLWETHGTPADNRGNEDSISGPFRLQPPKNGSVLRIIEYPPDKQRVPALAHERNASADGSGRYEALDRGNPAIQASTRPVRSTTRSCCQARSLR